jgi:hypothetical protein
MSAAVTTRQWSLDSDAPGRCVRHQQPLDAATPAAAAAAATLVAYTGAQPSLLYDKRQHFAAAALLEHGCQDETLQHTLQLWHKQQQKRPQQVREQQQQQLDRPQQQQQQQQQKKKRQLTECALSSQAAGAFAALLSRRRHHIGENLKRQRTLVHGHCRHQQSGSATTTEEAPQGGTMPTAAEAATAPDMSPQHEGKACSARENQHALLLERAVAAMLGIPL